MQRVGSRGPRWAVVAASAATLAAAAPAAASTLCGAVGGLRSHAQDTLRLDIHASAGAAHLADAVVTVDGAPFPVLLSSDHATRVASAPLCSPAGSCDVGRADVDFDSRSLPDGPHHIRVVVSDVDGDTTAIADQDFEVDNAPKHYETQVHLTVGSNVSSTAPGAPPGGTGSVRVDRAGACASAKLSMLLSQKPVRVRTGVAVLTRGRPYRFTGRLTCVLGNRRVSAPKRTKIQILALVKGRTAPKGTALVGSGGRVAIRLASPSARTLEFRFRSDGGGITRVRIKVQTVTGPRKHDPRTKRA
jgi:hypothetical protein